jgi:hypothetical protein
MKINEIITEHPDKTLLTEAWFLPALAMAVRAGAPMVARMLSRQGAQTVAKSAATAGVNTSKAIIANPGKVAAIAGGAYTYKTISDAVEAIQGFAGAALDQLTVANLAKVAVKYALPAAAIVAVLYGGKKLYDYMRNGSEESPVAEQSGILQIMADDEKQTTLVDPKTKIQTVVPKDPNKPGAITKDERGQLTLDVNVKGTVDRGIKPGDKVMVKQI